MNPDSPIFAGHNSQTKNSRNLKNELCLLAKRLCIKPQIIGLHKTWNFLADMNEPHYITLIANTLDTILHFFIINIPTRKLNLN